MPTPIEIIKGAGAALAAEYEKDAAQQDQAAIAKHVKAVIDVLNSDEFRDINASPDLVKAIADIAQLQSNFDAQASQLREAQKAGLSVRGTQLIIPGGKDARLQMLADGRAFGDDEMARNFAASVMYVVARNAKRQIDLPPYVKDMAESVWKESAGMTKAGDMDPGVAGSGAELVAAMFIPEMIRHVEAVGQFWTQARRLPLPTTGKTTIPKRTGGLTAYPTAVAAEIERSGPALGTVELTPAKWAVLTGIPNEFFRSPGMLADVGQWLGVEIVLAINYALDNAFINGDGTAAYGGITGILQSITIAAVAAASGNTSIADIDETDVGNVIGGLTKDYAVGDARWGFSLSVQRYLRNIRTSTGMPMYDRGDAREPSTIDAYPYVYGNRMPAASACTGASSKYGFFGDLKLSHIVGMIRDILIDTSDHVYFSSDMTAMRGLIQVDVAEQDATAVVVAKTAA